MFNRKSFATVTRFFNMIIEKFFNMISFIHLDPVRTKNKNQILKNLTIVVKFLFFFFFFKIKPIHLKNNCLIFFREVSL